MATNLTVPHTDLENPSIDISVVNNTVTARRAIMVANSYIDSAITQLGGSSIAIGTAVVRLDPDYFPGLGYLTVANIRNISLDEYLGLNCVGPLNSDGIPVDPNGYRVLVVDYGTKTYQLGSGPQNQSGPYFSISRQSHNEVVAVAKGGLQWEKSTNPSYPAGTDIFGDAYGQGSGYGVFAPAKAVTEIRSAFSANILRTDIKLIWHKVSDPDFNTIKTLVGTANLNTIFDATQGCVLFEGLRDQRQITYQGELVWEIEYAFSIREVKFQDKETPPNLLVGGWNHYPRSDAVEQDYVDASEAEPGSQYPWQKLLFKKTGKPIIPEVAWPDTTLFAVLAS